MLTIETRRDPVNQAAAAFLLPALLLLGGIVLKLLAGTRGQTPVRVSEFVMLGAFLLVGMLVLRGSRAALIVGTTLFALLTVLALVGGLVRHAPVAAMVLFVAWNGTLLFLMVRGIVAMPRKR